MWTHLLAVNKDILPRSERLFDPCASVIEVGFEVGCWGIHDVDPCDGHVWVIDRGKP